MLQLVDNKVKILLIDDDLDTLNMLQNVLELHGYECSAHLNPVLALEEYLVTDYDVVITDYKMPVMNGMKILKAILMENPAANIIVYTGQTDDVDIQTDAYVGGACDFFYKPINWNELNKVLNDLQIKMAV